MLSVKQVGIQVVFLSLWYDLNLGLNLSLPDHWQTLYPLSTLYANQHMV